MDQPMVGPQSLVYGLSLNYFIVLTLKKNPAEFNVPMEKRGKLIGAGGHRIKAIAEETGTIVETVDEEKMFIFAHSQEAMEEAQERVDAILNVEETQVSVLCLA